MVKFIFTAVSIILISCSNQTKKSDKEILEGKASYYYKNDDYQNAVMYFDSLIKLDTTVGQYYYKRAYSYSRLSLEKLAISDFEKAAGLNYKTADAYRNIALMSIGIEEDSIAL